MTTVAIFGATSAIAQAVARLFAAEGASLFLVARNSERLEVIAGDLRARGAARVTIAAADLGDMARHADLLRKMGQVDKVLLAYGTLGDQARSAADATVATAELSTNFVSVAALLTHIANVLEHQRSGTITVIGSVAGDRGRQSNYVYGSAKAGLAAFTQGLRHRLARSGVAVTMIKPGFVDTTMTAAFTKGGPLWVRPERVASDIRKAMERGPAVVYTPWFWRWIMLIIRLLPDAVMRRTRL
jgi:decaprenylphospho-beta-D-erythro-pentofuranosid-2-ulose 2-reductase